MPEEEFALSIRKIAVILFADIVDYTALMQSNEKKALDILQKFNNNLKELVAQNNGKIIQFYGDGCLAIFNSSVDATDCAQSLQNIFQSAPKVPVRIGLHAGDVVLKEGNVFGDAVNIASRIESIGVAGSVLISSTVRNQIKNKDQFKLLPIGKYEFKNVEGPMSVYALQGEGLIVPDKKSLDGKSIRHNPKTKLKSRKYISIAALTTIFSLIAVLFFWNKLSPTNLESVEGAGETEKSIAVLPFKNWSGNDSLEYFIDGMTDEVITRLTKVRALDKVISRTSVFKYKETIKNISEIAEELGVSHILESSFQKVANQMKIKLSLIEVATENAIWSDEFIGEWKSNDVFNIQAAVAENVVKNMKVSLSAEDFASIQQKPTDNDEAYNIFLQAEFQRHKHDNQSYKNAIPLYEDAIALDEDFALAYLGLADIFQTGGLVWGLFPERDAANNSQRLLEKALKIVPEDYRVFRNLFATNFYYHWDFEFCEKNFERLINYVPNSAEMNGSADYLMKTGRYGKSITWCDGFSKQFPSLSYVYAHKAKALLLAGKEEETLSLLQSKNPLYQDDQWYLREVCWVYLNLGKYPKYKENLTLLQSNFSDRVPIFIWYEAIQEILDKQNYEAVKLVGEIESLYEENSSGSPAWFISLYYFFIEDIEKGFHWLQRSYDRHEVEMLWLKEEPMLRPFREHPVYKELYEKMNWPE